MVAARTIEGARLYTCSKVCLEPRKYIAIQFCLVNFRVENRFVRNGKISRLCEKIIILSMLKRLAGVCLLGPVY